MTDDFAEVDITTFDQHVDTSITLSCYRETSRLNRMLRLFQRILTLIAAETEEGALLNFRGGIRKLHDSKGTLFVTWRHHADFATYRHIVHKAWSDFGESTIVHLDRDGYELTTRLGRADVSAKWERVGGRDSVILRSLQPADAADNWISVGEAALAALKKKMDEKK